MPSSQVTVDVPIRLQVLQSSVDELKKTLNTLKPNSNSFKALESIIKNMTAQMEKFQIQTSKPFGTQQQFNQATKTIDKMEESLARARIAVEHINFSDLKLEGEDLKKFNDLNQQLKDIEINFGKFKEAVKGDLFKDTDFKNFADTIDPNLIDKKFDQVVKAVQSKTKQISKDLQESKANLESYASQIDVGNQIKKMIKDEKGRGGGLSEKTLGSDTFDKFFQIKGNGDIAFKQNQRNPFFEWLKSSLTLNDQQIGQLQKMSAQKMSDFFKTITINDKDNFFSTQLKIAQDAATKQTKETTEYNRLRTDSIQAQAAMQALNPAIRQVAEEEGKMESATEAVNQGLGTLKNNLTENARSSQQFSNSQNQIQTQLQSFRDQLNQVNAQFIQLQRSQQTFNSIKSAIVNFMGFNQVLNITKSAITQAINHIKQLDTTMNGIAIVTNMTTADLWNQVDAYSEMAQKYGATIQGAYEVSKIYYQAGYETNEVLTLMNETLKLSKISGLDYAKTTDYMMTA